MSFPLCHFILLRRLFSSGDYNKTKCHPSQCLGHMWHIFYLERKQADRFNDIEIPRGTGSIKIVDKMKDVIARSEEMHAQCMQYVLFFLCTESCWQQAATAQPYRCWYVIHKRKVTRLGRLCAAEFHGFGLPSSVPSREAESGTVAWNVLSSKANVILT